MLAPADSGSLLERDDELETFAATIAVVREGNGAVICVVGPAGIGKTHLLREAADLAIDEGLRLFSARGGELEASFPYGIVRQLFEAALAAADPVRREVLLDAAAALSLPAFGRAAPLDAPSTTQLFALLHGLYWLAANLASEGPMMLAIDDAHWADHESLEWLRYLTRRIEDLPILVALAARRNEPGTGRDTLAAIESEPATSVVAPPPLSAAAVGELVARSLRGTSEQAFATACHAATGGNPFFLHELVASLREDGISPTLREAAGVHEYGPHAVTSAVFARLRPLPKGAVDVAKAVAILGAAAEPRYVGALTELAPTELAASVDALVAAEILQYGGPLDFVHPIVRQSIYREIPPAERSRTHAWAAHLLADSGEPAERVATQLLATDPGGGDPWIVESLQEAAEEVFVRGSPSAAAAYLARALEEPPTLERRGPVLHRLGSLELITGRPDQAGERLEEAVPLIADPRLRLDALHEVARAHGGAGRLREYAEILAQAGAEARSMEPSLAAEFDAESLAVASIEPSGVERAAQRLRRARDKVEGETVAECALLSAISNQALKDNEPVEVVGELAHRASRNGVLAGAEYQFVPFMLAVTNLTYAERFGAAEAASAEGIDAARRQGAPFWFAAASGGLAGASLKTGELWRAEAHARDCYGTVLSYGMPGLFHWSVTLLVDVMLERGGLVEADSILTENDLQGEAISRSPFSVPYLVRGRLRLAAGRPDEALTDLLGCGRHEAALGAEGSARLPWRSTAALANLALGDRAAARKLVAEESELARECGSRGQFGIALRAGGLVEGGPRGLELLGESAAVLEPSPLRIERARSLTELGAALRRANRRADAREPLRKAVELAHACGAAPVEDRALEELRATGARPRRVELSGVESLTATERRVAEMAARGLTNKQIAQAQFVSVRTVETHLTHVYGKLELSSRGELSAALGPPDA